MERVCLGVCDCERVCACATKLCVCVCVCACVAAGHRLSEKCCLVWHCLSVCLSLAGCLLYLL